MSCWGGSLAASLDFAGPLSSTKKQMSSSKAHIAPILKKQDDRKEFERLNYYQIWPQDHIVDQQQNILIYLSVKNEEHL